MACIFNFQSLICDRYLFRMSCCYCRNFWNCCPTNPMSRTNFWNCYFCSAYCNWSYCFCSVYCNLKNYFCLVRCSLTNSWCCFGSILAYKLYHCCMYSGRSICFVYSSSLSTVLNKTTNLTNYTYCYCRSILLLFLV